MGLVITSGFPRDMPEGADGLMPIATATFGPVYQQAVAPTRGGRPQVSNLGSDLWGMDFGTIPMLRDDLLDYAAWLHSLRGGSRVFKAWHPMLRYPLAYQGGFGSLKRYDNDPFDGTCTLYSIGEALDTLTLSDLPADFMFKRGDMVSMPFGSSRTLHRIVAGGTSNEFGAVTVTIEPTLPISFSNNPAVTVSLVKPWCLAVVDATSIKTSMTGGMLGSIQFSAVQTY